MPCRLCAWRGCSGSQFQHDIALKEIGWEPLSACLTHADALFKCGNEQAEAVWQAEGYPFIPAHFIHTRKFIQFAEQPASSGTRRSWRLEERQKIRVIHGETGWRCPEQSRPIRTCCTRRHGLSWQMIQSDYCRAGPAGGCHGIT